MSKFYNGFTTHILCTKTNVLTSMTTIKRLAIKLGEYISHYALANEASSNLKKCGRIIGRQRR